MLRILTVLIGMFFAFSVQAITNQELIKNLNSRFIDLKDKGSLIKSYSDHNQSYIYDQALAIIAFTKENDQRRARRLLKAMNHLQMKDGSLYFSYNLDGSSVYPKAGDKRIAGAMAWVALAASHYQKKFSSKEFVNFNRKLLSYLHSQIQPIEVKGVKIKALKFAPSDVVSTSFPENEIAALEHNIDLYVAIHSFVKLNRNNTWKDDIANLRTFILSMWDKSNSHFWSGANFKTGHINKNEYYLDNQSWTLLALSSLDLEEISPSEALEINCERLFVEHNGVKGFMDSRPTRFPASEKFVWSEGTLGQILAMNKIQKLNRKNLTCNNLSSADFLISIKKMKKEDGGIAYASLNKKDFTTSSSVAGTAWMYFAINDFNPFEVN